MEPQFNSSVLDSINNVINGKPISLPEVTVYGKKQYAEALDKLAELQQQYMSEMSKYKKDSIQYRQANKAYQDSLYLYNDVAEKTGILAESLSSGYRDEFLSNVSKAYDPKTKKWAMRPPVKDRHGKELVPARPYWDSEEYGVSADRLNKMTPAQIADLRKKNDVSFYKEALQGKGRYTDILPAEKYDEASSWYLEQIAKNLKLAEEKQSSNVMAAGGGLGAAPITHVRKELEVVKHLSNQAKKSPIKPVGTRVSPELPPVPIYKKPTVEPTPPNKPTPPADVKYDKTYETLNMKPLWATDVKQNPNTIIGTLHPTDPLYNKKGFTIEEAMQFPKEVRDKYNIDFIYSQIKNKAALNKAKIQHRKK